MLTIAYRITEDFLEDSTFNDNDERPFIYGVFVIESDFGLSSGDLSFLHDDFFELFSAKDDLFLCFLNITLMNVELLKNKESSFILDIGFESPPPTTAILFRRNNNVLHISKVKFSDDNYPVFIFCKDLPNNLKTHEHYQDILLSEWIDESVKTTTRFINELISYDSKFKTLKYVKLIEESLNFINSLKYKTI